MSIDSSSRCSRSQAVLFTELQNNIAQVLVYYSVYDYLQLFDSNWLLILRMKPLADLSRRISRGIELHMRGVWYEKAWELSVWRARGLSNVVLRRAERSFIGRRVNALSPGILTLAVLKAKSATAILWSSSNSNRLCSTLKLETDSPLLVPKTARRASFWMTRALYATLSYPPPKTAISYVRRGTTKLL